MCGKQAYRTAGQQAYRTAGKQAYRTAGKQAYRQAGLQDSRQAGLQDSRQAGIQDSRTAGKQDSRQEGIQDSRHIRQQAYRTAGKQASRTAGKKAYRTAGRHTGQQANATELCSVSYCTLTRERVVFPETPATLRLRGPSSITAPCPVLSECTQPPTSSPSSNTDTWQETTLHRRKGSFASAIKFQGNELEICSPDHSSW